MSLVSNNMSLTLQPSSFDTKAIIRGPYTNWFSLELWLPIAISMKQHMNHIATLKYLRIAHYIKGSSTRLYDELSWGSVNEWLTKIGEIQGQVLGCVARE